MPHRVAPDLKEAIRSDDFIGHADRVHLTSRSRVNQVVSDASPVRAITIFPQRLGIPRLDPIGSVGHRNLEKWSP
jgi:hypothetical protein